MGKDLADAFPAARDTFAAVDEALGMPLSRTMWEGPEDTLQETHNTQPAILAHSAAVWPWWRAGSVRSPGPQGTVWVSTRRTWRQAASPRWTRPAWSAVGVS